jgi:glycosyltransferase involved in cell wall biosynthesis
VRGYVVSRADLTLPVSPEIAERLGVCRTRAIPMGAAPMFAEVAHRADDAAPFLFVGRLADNKGVDVALEALAAVPGARLRIIGDGPERPALEDLARALGVGGRCEFLGPLDKRSVASEMGGARALILASRTGADGSEEGSPTVLMEAVLAGVPVIASRIGGVPALFEHEMTALLFDQGDIYGLAAHMDRAQRSPEHMEKLAREASLRRGPLATFSETARRYIDAIAALL